MEQAGKYLACPSALDVAGQGRGGEYSGFCLHQLSQCRTVRQRKSYGKQRKLTLLMKAVLWKESDSRCFAASLSLDVWMDVPYEPGEVKVVAYDASGNPAEEKVIRTAGEAPSSGAGCRPHPLVCRW
ncbi:DUF4982 domain-containing protein [Bacteroides uniformis]|nr:DUF4982 domain-containing protein [Bacteroides uniformis]MCS2415970.1 DUF4982 domain-containing protein [Bacteroides uniformis]